jgi:homocitrate synthase NifV
MSADAMTKNINIIDSTLRSGEQSAGVVFSKHEKIRIVKLLDEIGIPEIEIGMPSVGQLEKETIRKY